jgi:DNA-binding response OmpR family regulator
MCAPGAGPGAPASIPASILVIEDEPSIAQAVAARLRSEGHRVTVAADGPSGVEACDRLAPDLVVLDLMLPGLDGLSVCERIQAERPVPVLMLTARDSEDDVLTGLATGADDYLTKPFSSRELVARVHALLRRVARAREEAGRRPPGAELRIGGVVLDLPARRAHRDGTPVHLTPTEFELLATLAAEPDRVFTREELLALVWGYEVASGTRAVDSHVAGLRRKLSPGVIRTVHGVGYGAGGALAEAQGASR